MHMKSIKTIKYTQATWIRMPSTLQLSLFTLYFYINDISYLFYPWIVPNTCNDRKQILLLCLCYRNLWWDIKWWRWLWLGKFQWPYLCYHLVLTFFSCSRKIFSMGVPAWWYSEWGSWLVIGGLIFCLVLNSTQEKKELVT